MPSWAYLFVGLVAVAVNFNTLPAEFAFDDYFAVVYNGDVNRDANPIVQLLSHDFWGQSISSDMSHKSYRPLTALSFRTIRCSWDALPTQLTSHATGRVRRSIAAPDPMRGQFSRSAWLAVYMFQKRAGRQPTPFVWPSQPGPTPARGEMKVQEAKGTELPERIDAGRDTTGRDEQSLEFLRKVAGPAVFTALLFALHPVHAEAVAGIVGHAELLSASLCIPALLLYFTAADGSHRLSSTMHLLLVGSAACAVWMAALCKEIGITVIGAMIVYDILLVPLHTESASPPHTDADGSKSAALSGGGGGGAQGPGARTKGVGLGGEGAAAGSPAGAGKGMSGSRSRRQGRRPTEAVDSESGGGGGGAGLAGHGGGSRGGGVGWAKILRILLLAAAGVLYLKMRGWVAGDHLVRIYRRVENPIPFLPSLTHRVLSTGYLHARYAALLVWPQHMSADWSFQCIPMLSSHTDPRNLLTLALYGAFVMATLAAAPWGVLLEWWGGRESLAAATAPSHLAARWRLTVLAGLLVGPFFPASNVLFYVGTFIGERLLYFPSIGFCLLCADLASQLASPSGSAVDPAAAAVADMRRASEPPPSADPASGSSNDRSSHGSSVATGGGGGGGSAGKQGADGTGADRRRGLAGRELGSSASNRSQLGETDTAGLGGAGGGGGGRDGAGSGEEVERVRSGAAGAGLRQSRAPRRAARRQQGGAMRGPLVVLQLLVVVLLCCGSRLYMRNLDWLSEEALFDAALTVCSESAKVRLNSGILERRRQNFPKALDHFERARQIDPTYCEPTYWIGVTHINSDASHIPQGMVELEAALHCKYVAVEAIKALNTVFQALHQMHPEDGSILMRWATILVQPHVSRVGDACDAAERAAVLFATARPSRVSDAKAALQLCGDALDEAMTEAVAVESGHVVVVSSRLTGSPNSAPLLSPPLSTQALEKMLGCAEARLPLYEVLSSGVGLSTAPALQAVYKYISLLDKTSSCRADAEALGGSGARAVHMQLVHRFQSASPSDPWLQREWAYTLLQTGHPTEAVRHFQAARSLFTSNDNPPQPGGGGGGGAPAVHTLSFQRLLNETEGLGLALASALDAAQASPTPTCEMHLEVATIKATLALALRRLGGGWRLEEARRTADDVATMRDHMQRYSCAAATMQGMDSLVGHMQPLRGKGRHVGLRSAAAGGLFLQARRRPPHHLCFFSPLCGVWEQWQVRGCQADPDPAPASGQQ
ncbi:MAG: hypothetical protein WDW36_002888 [Sanguina aurantia]